MRRMVDGNKARPSAGKKLHPVDTTDDGPAQVSARAG
jgi:hypothetical protein